MYVRVVSQWRKATVSLFFVLLFLTLPNNAQDFQYLYAVETINDELENSDGLTQNKEESKPDDSMNNTGTNGCCFRLLRQGKTPVKLETVITRFQGNFSSADGTTRPVTVDLIGTIHFAEQNYYEELNRIFQEYDVVVFEMVTQKGADVAKLIQQDREDKEKGHGSILNIVPFTQEKLATALGFRYQIDGIDYSASNLKRGDAYVEEFLVKLFSDLDVPNFVLSCFFSAFLDNSVGKTEGIVFVLLCARDKRLAGRRLLALELENSDEDQFITENSEKTSGETLSDDAMIGFRNQKALKVVRKELEQGKSKIAIFYGAAHLPDFAQRLEQDFGMKSTFEPRWIPAWDMEKK